MKLLKFRFMYVLDKLLHILHLYRQIEICYMIEEVSNDFRCERHLRECISDSYLSIHLAIHSELVNAAMIDNDLEECEENSLCSECRECREL